MLLTIFTPTYNRAGLLPRLFQSLEAQTCLDFEWIVVDDGSTDDTQEVVNRLADCCPPFDISYLSQPNGGKHRAINLGVKHARGELFFIVDSDDRLPASAVGDIIETYSGVRDDRSFAGICGMDAFFDGRIVGTGLPEEVIDSTSVDIRYKYHVEGDLKEVFRTSVLREFPFPEIDGEKFCPEALVWNRIASRYRLRYINKVIYQVEYQPEGLTSRIVTIRMRSPKASMMCYAEMARLTIPYVDRLKAAVNYWRFRFCAKGDNNPSIDYKWYFVIPLGYLMHLNDINTTKP